MKHALKLDGQTHEVWLSRASQGYELHLSSTQAAVSLRTVGQQLHELVVDGRRMALHLAVHGDEIHLHIDGQTATLSHSHNLQRFASQADDGVEALSRAPMPGSVIALNAVAGQEVRRGDLLLVIESMKMETAIFAGLDGVVREVHVQIGQTFDRDAVLVSLEPSGRTA